MGILLRLLLVVLLLLPLAPQVVSAREVGAAAIKFNNRGVDLFNAGKYEKAIEAYNEAIRLSPTYTEAYSNRGAAFDALNNPERAVQDYTAAIQLSPKLTAAYSNRAAAYCDLGDFHNALTDYNVVVVRTPRDAYAFNGRGSCYKALGDLQAALRDFERAVSLKPGYSRALKNRDAVKQSLAATAGGQTPAPLEKPAAKPLAAPAPIAVQPAAPTVVPANPVPTPVSAPVRAVPTGNPGPLAAVDGVIHHVLGNLFMTVGQYKAAADQYSTALKDNQADVYAYFRRGNAWAAAGESQLALLDFEQAVVIRPHFHPAYKRRDQLRSILSVPPAGSAPVR